MTGHSVDATFTGAVFEVHLFLEQREFKLQRDPASGHFVGKDPAFDVAGSGLRIRLNGKAMNGTDWKLSLKVDDHGPFEEKGTAHGGAFGFPEMSVPLPLKDKGTGA